MSQRPSASFHEGIVNPARASLRLASAQKRGLAAFIGRESSVMGSSRGTRSRSRAASSATSYHVAKPEFTQ